MNAPGPAQRGGAFDVDALRADFPALGTLVHNRRLAYLDSAASTLRPRAVIDAVTDYYTRGGANVHRGVHLLSQQATLAYEASREKLARFLGAAGSSEIVFVRGTTEALNLVAHGLARKRLEPGDEVLVTELEHHSNIVPWQIACEATGARLVVAPVTDAGEVTLEAFEAKLSPRTRVAAIAHVSNTLGTVLPVAHMAERAHAHGALVVVDGAQAAPHLPVDVQALGCDFYALSGHKLYGPSGIGVLYGRAELLSELPPYQGGGSMIRQVSFARTTYADPPERFEAGTPNVAGAIGLGAAVDYLATIDREGAMAHEHALLEHATEQLRAQSGVRVIGTAADKIAVISFVVDGVHPHDLGTIVDAAGVAIRTGHHCTQPLMERFGVPATARASFGLYNTRDDVEALVGAVADARKLFAR